MAKLSDNVTNAAWEDFKNHLIDVGLLIAAEDVRQGNFHSEIARMQIAKMAFKQGFVAGSDAAKKMAITYEPIRNARRITKNRVARSDEQRKMDGELLEDYLRGCIDPMPLNSIIEQMKGNGQTHWNNNNGSSFIQTAIKDGYCIKRTGYGVYGYDWEGN